MTASPSVAKITRCSKASVGLGFSSSTSSFLISTSKGSSLFGVILTSFLGGDLTKVLSGEPESGFGVFSVVAGTLGLFNSSLFTAGEEAVTGGLRLSRVISSRSAPLTRDLYMLTTLLSTSVRDDFPLSKIALNCFVIADISLADLPEVFHLFLKAFASPKSRASVSSASLKPISRKCGLLGVAAALWTPLTFGE